MKSKLEAILAKLDDLLSQAQDLADSENEKTSEKYADTPSHIEEAAVAIQNAIDELEG